MQADGTYIYKAITDNNLYTVKSNKEEVIVLNEDNTVIQTIDIIDKDLELADDYTISIPNGPWRDTHMKGYTSSNIRATDLSLVISIIAAISKLDPAAGVIVAVATWYYSRNLKEGYYYYKVQSRVYNGWVQQRTYTRYYSNSSYSNIIGTPGFSVPRNIHRVR